MKMTKKLYVGFRETPTDWSGNYVPTEILEETKDLLRLKILKNYPWYNPHGKGITQEGYIAKAGDVFENASKRNNKTVQVRLSHCVSCCLGTLLARIIQEADIVCHNINRYKTCGNLTQNTVY